MVTLDELLGRERRRRAGPSTEMQKAIAETVAEIQAAFAKVRPVKIRLRDPALNREEADRHG